MFFLQLELKHKDMNVQQIVSTQLASRPKPIFCGLPFFRGLCCSPFPRKLTRVGGHRRQPGFKSGDALMPGILDRMACGLPLALGIWGRAKCRRPPLPRKAKKLLFFEECWTCIKHRKYRQKWLSGGVGLGQEAGAQKG